MTLFCFTSCVELTATAASRLSAKSPDWPKAKCDPPSTPDAAEACTRSLHMLFTSGSHHRENLAAAKKSRKGVPGTSSRACTHNLSSPTTRTNLSGCPRGQSMNSFGMLTRGLMKLTSSLTPVLLRSMAANI